MSRQNRRSAPMLRASARGMVAAMGMSGVRSVTANLGLLEKPPPQKIIERDGPALLQRLGEEHRAVAAELAHWAYGTAGGAVFGLFPARVRTHRLAGPVYGLAIWLGFETVIAPLLGVQHGEGPVRNRIVLSLDHVLYGVVVAGRLAPDPEIIERERN